MFVCLFLGDDVAVSQVPNSETVAVTQLLHHGNDFSLPLSGVLLFFSLLLTLSFLVLLLFVFCVIV
jgi:hypothetical protein